MIMPVKNNIAVGFLLAIITPAIAWTLAEFAFKNSTLILNKPAAPYLIAIAFNLFIIRYCFKSDNDQTGIGAIICTFIIMMLVFLFKMRLHA